MSLREYLKKTEIDKEKARHPISAMPIKCVEKDNIARKYGFTEYCPEVLLVTDHISKEGIKSFNRP